MKIEIEITPEMVDEIIKQELRWHRDQIKVLEDLSKEDIKYYKKLEPALDLVCDYFGVDLDQTESQEEDVEQDEYAGTRIPNENNDGEPNYEPRTDK